MLVALLVCVVLMLIDFMLLLIMPKFYFKIGIPIYKQSAILSKKVPIRDLGKYFGFTEKLVYKVKDDIIIFRTRFNYLNLYKLNVLSIVKGEAKINNGEINIIQRVNLSSLFLLLYFVYITLIQNIGIFYKVIIFIAILVIAFIGYLFLMVRNVEIEKVRIDIRDNLNKDHSTCYIKKHK